MVEFKPWYVPGEALYCCVDCGTLVTDQDAHTQWHEQLS